MATFNQQNQRVDQQFNAETIDLRNSTFERLPDNAGQTELVPRLEAVLRAVEQATASGALDPQVGRTVVDDLHGAPPEPDPRRPTRGLATAAAGHRGVAGGGTAGGDRRGDGDHLELVGRGFLMTTFDQHGQRVFGAEINADNGAHQQVRRAAAS